MSTTSNQEMKDRCNEEAFRLLVDGRMGMFWREQAEGLLTRPEAVEHWELTAELLIQRLKDGQNRVRNDMLAERNRKMMDAGLHHLEPVSSLLRMYRERSEIQARICIEPRLGYEDFLDIRGLHWRLTSRLDNPVEAGWVAVIALPDDEGGWYTGFDFVDGPSWDRPGYLVKRKESGEAVALLLKCLSGMMTSKNGVK